MAQFVQQAARRRAEMRAAVDAAAAASSHALHHHQHSAADAPAPPPAIVFATPESTRPVVDDAATRAKLAKYAKLLVNGPAGDERNKGIMRATNTRGATLEPFEHQRAADSGVLSYSTRIQRFCRLPDFRPHSLRSVPFGSR